MLVLENKVQHTLLLGKNIKSLLEISYRSFNDAIRVPVWIWNKEQYVWNQNFIIYLRTFFHNLQSFVCTYLRLVRENELLSKEQEVSFNRLLKYFDYFFLRERQVYFQIWSLTLRVGTGYFLLYKQNWKYFINLLLSLFFLFERVFYFISYFYSIY